ncbi:unnamed protein product, partial [Phaeothamnion confervicola]
SPLTRGNPDERASTSTSPRPIPAHAGEPSRALLGLFCGRAYPRSRGGTNGLEPGLLFRLGLSPLTRGNLEPPPAWVPVVGPIPAHAGEPWPALPLLPVGWAYPRSRGGTCTDPGALASAPGLSPLTRGNRHSRSSKVSR